MEKANSWHIDGMILGTFLSTIFFSATYPYIHKCIVMQIPDYFLAVNQVINCGGTVIWGTVWNKKTDFLFSHYTIICVLETILGITTTGFAIFGENIAAYYILDTIVFATVTRNILCGSVKLKAIRYKTEEERSQFDNNDNSACAVATIIGSIMAMYLRLSLPAMLIVATVGNAIDNMFFVYIYSKSRKGKIEEG